MLRTAQMLILCLFLSLAAAEGWPQDVVPQAAHASTELSGSEGLSRMQVLGQIVAGALTGAFLAVLSLRFVFHWRRKKTSPFGSAAKSLARRT